MSVRTKNFLLCTFALLIGAIVYILFRPTSMVAVIVGDNRWLTQLRSWLKPVSYGFVRYYLGDFLWMLALCCGLYAVLLPKPRERILCIFGSVLLGAAWELLQWLGAIAGTGDWFDIFAYGMAGIASIIINRKGIEK